MQILMSLTPHALHVPLTAIPPTSLMVHMHLLRPWVMVPWTTLETAESKCTMDVEDLLAPTELKCDFEVRSAFALLANTSL